VKDSKEFFSIMLGEKSVLNVAGKIVLFPIVLFIMAIVVGVELFELFMNQFGRLMNFLFIKKEARND
jgi:positive regulator of sigma E activity